MKSVLRGAAALTAAFFCGFLRAADPASATPYLEVLPHPVLTGLIHLPSLLVTEADTVLLIAQSRIKKGDHDPSDVVLVRSTDQGRTWSDPIRLFASGETGRIGYSCMLVEDRKRSPHAVLAYYTVGPANWKPGQLTWYGRRSVDEGKTWSDPFEVRSDGQPNSLPSNGGHGFQFSTGRMVIPGRADLLSSDDGGLSWSTVGTAETVETKVVPVTHAGTGEPDTVYLTTRKSTTYRMYGDFGRTLVEQGDHGNTFTTRGRNPGLARYSDKILLMSGITDMKSRTFCLTFSSNQGRSWSRPKQIDAKAWYSDLGVTRDGTIIAAYNVNFSSDLKIARMNLAWVMQAPEPTAAR